MATTDIFRSMIAYWKTFDLQKLQEELDRTASILTVRSEETDISRQLLLQKSRDFKRNTPDDVQKAIAPLLKSFQSEIDGLLRRSKLAESAFLSIYKKVIHMPDMLPVLMAAEQLQSKVKRLSGCSAGFSSEKIKEVGSDNKNKCSNDEDVCVNNQNSLNFESNEPHQNNRENTDNCMYSCRESDLSSGDDAVDPLHNFMTSRVSELPSDNKEQNSSIHDRNSADAVMRNSDIVTLCDNHPADSPADSPAGLQGQATAFRLNNELDSSEIQDLGKTDRTDTGQGKGAMDDVATEELDERRSAISEDCRVYMDHRTDGDLTQVILKDQTEPEADSLSDGCGSSVETHAKLSIHGIVGGDQSIVLNLAESNGELDCVKEQTLETAKVYRWNNNVSQLEDEQEVQNCKKIFAKKFGEDKGISLFSVESLASEIGQEVVSSFQSSQFPVQNLWLPDTETNKEESSSLLSSSADVLSTYAVQYSSEFPANCWDLTCDDVKTETADELASLDTMDVSRRIREILSFHNLGQRLFARYVLGLSQGTVSELLSKPKPWEKLTEKGRESYRKMHQWAIDERNIQILKSLSSPKCNVSSSSSGHTDSAAEERIAQILSEAQAAMQCKQEAVDKSNVLTAQPKASEMQLVEQITETEKGSRKPKTSRKGSGHTSGSRSDASKSRKVHADSENLTREIVARIYQEELEKLAQVAEASGNMVELLNYRQELARLSQGWTKQPCKPDAQKSETEDKENQKETPKAIIVVPKKHLNDRVDVPMERIGEVTDEPQDLSISGSAEACQQSLEGINLSILKSCDSPSPLPSVLPVSLPSSGSSNGLLSPLQRMQSIANSLMLQSSSSPTGFQPTRAILPPISQEQFDLYANINTDDLVKQVKDVLSQYSISQRLFGEYVLGLSQGSVSDLLARPKPWHLLTQKGREPFIRMQMFIDDPEAVQKLVASQYRVPTEKLLRSNSSSHLDAASHGMVSDSCGEVAECCNIPPPTLQSSKPFRSLTTGCGNTTPPCSTVHSSSNFTTVSSPQSTSGSLPASFNKPLANGVGFPSMGVAMVPSVLSLFGATFLPSAQFGPLVNMDMHHLYGGGPNASSEAGISTAGPELDTQTITARVKEVLQLNNLGQKLFGEAVLELSQGSVSELLSKPKPWHMLSLKGREPFVKMQIWLSDPLGVQKLHTYQTHMSGRRRKSGCDGSSNDKPGNQKKPRLFFSEEQKEALKSAYIRDPYPNQLAIEQLANELDIGVKTVINWFHNHRMRAKQHHSCNSPSSTTAGSPSSSILTHIKSEVHDDLTEQGASRSAVTFPQQEDNSASSNSCRSRCDSGIFSGLDGRANKLASSGTTSKSESSFPSSVNFSCSKNGKLNKRKRARPHRLCSGAADTGDLQVAEEYQVTLDVAIDLSVNRPRGNANKDHLLALKRDPVGRGLENQGETVKSQSDDSLLQTSDAADVKIELPDNWNGNRVKNIEKLQQNLLLAPSDDWEF